MTMQLTLSLVPGLTQRHRTLRDCVQTVVISSKGGVAGIAPALDMSPSLLGRKLAGNPDDQHRTLDIEDFDRILTELVKEKNLTPLYWLIEKYLPSDQQRRDATIDRIGALLAEVTELLPEVAARKGRR